MTEETIQETETTTGSTPPKAEETVEISLARANKLRNKLDSYLKKLEEILLREVHSTIQVYPNHKMEKIESNIAEKKSEIQALFQEYGTTNEFLTNLRATILMKNAECGVSHTMARIESSKKALSFFKKVFNGRIQEFSKEDLEFLLDDIRAARNIREESRSVYGQNLGPIQAPLYTKEEIQAEDLSIRRIEKSISDMEENRNSLNHSNTISLTKESLEWLEARQLA